MGGTPEPAGKELLGGPRVKVAPEMPEELLECSGTGHVKLAGLEGLEDLRLDRQLPAAGPCSMFLRSLRRG